ncbi:MAG: hypothetical protein Q9209_006820 [Squamulea sp. 1 TL-2023]
MCAFSDRRIDVHRCFIQSVYSTLFSINGGDASWNLTGVGNWSIIETNVTIICACLITTKPALRKAFPEKLVASARSGWSQILSKTSKSDLNQQGSEATTNSTHEFRRIKEQPRHCPLLHETADRFGPLKLDEPHHPVVLHDLEPVAPQFLAWKIPAAERHLYKSISLTILGIGKVAYVIAPWQERPIIHIAPDKPTALKEHDEVIDNSNEYQIYYTNGSGIDNEVGAAVIRTIHLKTFGDPIIID